MIKGYKNTTLLPTGYRETRWTGGFWGSLFEHCRIDMLFSMEAALLDKNNAAYLGNFDAASGRVPDRHYGTYWSDGDCYKWLEAAAHVYAVTGSPELDSLMDKYIEKISAAQEDDGYICTQIQLVRQRNRWSNFEFHELYNFGHLFTAAAAHFEITAKPGFLEIARKAGDHLYETFAPRPKKLVHFGFNPSQIMGCVELYRVTGNEKFLKLAEIFIDMRGFAAGGSDKHQARIPLKEEDEAVGHAVTANYLWAGATDLLMEKEDNDLRRALERIWCNVTRKKLYVTGGVAPYYEGLSSRGDRVSESFAWEYQLPNRRGYNETCANISFAMWNYRLLILRGEAEYGDMMELVMYNSGLSGGNHDGTAFYYANPLSRRNHSLFKETSDQLGDNHAAFLNAPDGERWKTHICYCCPPQYVRTVAKIHTWSYAKSEKALWVHLYGAGEFKGEIPGFGGVHIIQETEYPWDGSIKLQVHKGAGDWTLKLRIPGWCRNAGFSINGTENSKKCKPGSYLSLNRTWKEGDVVTLILPLEPRLIQANPLVEEIHGMVCIKRGPLVYCLESPDLPENVKMDDVIIPVNVKIVPRFDSGFFDGAVLLDADCLTINGSDFGNDLYREIGEITSYYRTLTFIPYYLWANRGLSEMSVWFPMSC